MPFEPFGAKGTRLRQHNILDFDTGSFHLPLRLWHAPNFQHAQRRDDLPAPEPRFLCC